MQPGGKPPLALVFSLVLFVHWIVAGLDRGRFHWSDNVPGWLQAFACSRSQPAMPWHYGLCA
jgi:hypothetical protein